MNESKRQYLLSGDTISLRRINIKTGKAIKGDATEFTVMSVIGEGGSSVCYEASCENDGTNGRLKEFYPLDIDSKNQFYCLERGGDNQLYIPDATEDEMAVFAAARDEVKTSYCTLARAKNQPYGQVLSNYIPVFELYEGISEDDTRTIYVWTRHDRKVKGFDEYLSEMRADIKKHRNPEIHLYNILNAMLTLTKCIRALHTADLLYMDVKPENFGLVTDEKGQVNSSSISLYDVNSIFSADSDGASLAGTAGYRAPEVIRGEANCRSDIYSIGATLFSAIVVLDGFDGVYKDEFYNQIGNIVLASELMRASDINSNTALNDALIDILKKCLAYDPGKRYKACSYLVDDLSAAIAFLLPGQAKQKLTALGQELKIVDIEKNRDETIETGATGAIQRLLFTDPLYEAGQQDGKIKVLVLGAGTYGVKFIDIALEVSQVSDCYLDITCVSNNSAADKERYLSTRPAFCRFFEVDGVSPEGDSLGTISFVSTDSNIKKRSFSREDDETNRVIIDDILGLGEYGYVFIALGDDELNYKIAKELSGRNIIPDKMINFVCYGEKREFDCGDPIYVNDVIAGADEYDDLKRMAFNCHILYSGSLNVDIRKKKGEFSSPYNFNSSFSNVLSIKYKLHSIGIDMSDVKLAAKQFNELVEAGRKDIINELVMYEHRRWMVNSICQGWDTLTDYDSLTDATKDKKARLHPCIVRSTSAWSLNSPKWKTNGHKRWDTADEAELAELDELDRVSIMVHRSFKAKADAMMESSGMYSDVEGVRYILRHHIEALKAFDRFVLCLKEIAEGKINQPRLYSCYRAEMINQLKKVPEDIREAAEKNIQIIESEFYPVLQSKRYTDYKAYDQKLVRGIPFILTYSASVRLCIPFGIESRGEYNNRVLFDNIASAMVLNPSVITYIVDTDDIVGGSGRFFRALEYALNCIEDRKMQAKVNLLFVEPSDAGVVTAEFREKIKSLSKRVGNIEVITYVDDEALKAALTVYFKKNRSNKRRAFSAVEKNDTGISKLMRGMGCYSGLPVYSFNSASAKFKTNELCEYFNYINSSEYLRVSDMFSFKNAESVSTTPEMQLDYEYFWKLYKSANPADPSQKNEQIWKFLCDTLSDQAEDNDILASVEIPKSNEKNVEERSFLIPHFCRAAVEKILCGLKRISPVITGEFPEVSYKTTQSCTVKVETTQKIAAVLEGLFANPYLLYDASKISVVKIGRNACILFENLIVTDLKRDTFAAAKSKEVGEGALELLEKLYKDGYILDLNETEKNGKKYLSFCYPSPQIKSLLTMAGRVLELYVYYKAMEQNYFDDIVSSCEIVWNDENVSNEFDVVLTKGFRALIVECKAQNQIDQNYYYKISQLNQRFGINSTAVLIADTVERTWHDNSVNETQRSRGRELGVVTIFEHSDISKTSKSAGIGSTLKKLMEKLIEESEE